MCQAGEQFVAAACPIVGWTTRVDRAERWWPAHQSPQARSLKIRIDPVNKILFAFASYNAGPGRIRQLRREAARRGLDPNVWFGNVEQVVSARVGRETVDYVSNIFKYYIAYRLVIQEEERREAIRAKIGDRR